MTRYLRFRKGLSTLAIATQLASFGVALVFADGYMRNNSYDNNYNNYNYNSYDGYNNYGFNNYNSGYPYYNYSDSSYRYYDYNYNYNYRPNCSITITNSSGSYGYDRYVTLAWSSSYATSAYISGVGSVGTNGAQAIYYPYSGSYTLTVYGPGGTASCVTQNQYSTQYYNTYSPYTSAYNYPTYTYPNTYAHPTYTYPTYSVNLSQTPYTGFDYGPVGNAIYFLALALFAISGAYLAMYYMPRLNLASEIAAAARNQIRFIRSRIFF